MTDIYSPENIARSRSRAAAIRAQVSRGELDATWLETAAEMEAYARERELLAQYEVPTDPAAAIDTDCCQ